jgi:hypothetical protein
VNSQNILSKTYDQNLISYRKLTSKLDLKKDTTILATIVRSFVNINLKRLVWKNKRN